MGTIVVGFIVLAIMFLAIRSLLKDKKSGKSIQCGGDCRNCCRHCH